MLLSRSFILKCHIPTLEINVLFKVKPRKTSSSKDKSKLQHAIRKDLKRREQAMKRTYYAASSSRRRRRTNSQPVVEFPVNSRGLTALPDELLLEIISHLPSIIPKITSSLQRESRVPVLGRREAILSLSLVCRNLRRFALPYTFESIEVWTGSRVYRDVKGKPFILGGSRDNYRMNKEFTIELLRQLHFVTIKHPHLRRHVRTVAVELRGHRFEEVSKELFRCLPLFPNLAAMHLVSVLPASYYDTRYLSEARIDPELYTALTLPSVHTLVIASPFHRLVTVCPNLKHLRVFGYHQDPPYSSLNNRFQHFESLFIRHVHPDLPKFINLRKLIVSDEFAVNRNIVSDKMLAILQSPNFPRLQALHIVVSFRANTIYAQPVIEIFEQAFRHRQLTIAEDKYLCVEFTRISGRHRQYVKLGADGTRDTDAASSRDMFF